MSYSGTVWQVKENYVNPEDFVDPQNDFERVQVNVLDLVDRFQAWSSIPRYDGTGEESFGTWVGQLEDAFTLQEPAPTEAQKCARFKFHLSGSARDYFEHVDDTTRANFEQLKDAFRIRFESKTAKVTATQKLVNCMQMPTEDVGVFAERFRQYVKAATVGEREEVRKSRMLNDFIEKLRAKLKFHVRAADPTTFEEAFEAALKYESLLDEHDGDQCRAHASVNLARSGDVLQTRGFQSRLESMETMVSEMGGQIRQLALDANDGYLVTDNYGYVGRGTPQYYQGPGTSRKPPSMLCEFCGKVGHLVESCFALQPHLTPADWESDRPTRSVGSWSRYSTHAQFSDPPVQSSAVAVTQPAQTKPNEAGNDQEVRELRAANKALKDQNERLSNLAYGTSRPGELSGSVRGNAVSVWPPKICTAHGNAYAPIVSP